MKRGLPRKVWTHFKRSIAEHWGVLEAQRQLAGRPLDVPDGQIAATALDLVTRNLKDFAGLGVAVLNPWEKDPDRER
ncbi:MAG: hypothetical protein JO108_08910 [Acidobacteriaceae bacterium]|nr:hypothetical protein [Acidobacteriaceae bacterium]